MNKARFMQFASAMAHDCFEMAEENGAIAGNKSNAEMAKLLSDFLLSYAECMEEMEGFEAAIAQAAQAEAAKRLANPYR